VVFGLGVRGLDGSGPCCASDVPIIRVWKCSSSSSRTMRKIEVITESGSLGRLQLSRRLA
jgi:hypothetical protein